MREVQEREGRDHEEEMLLRVDLELPRHQVVVPVLAPLAFGEVVLLHPLSECMARKNSRYRIALCSCSSSLSLSENLDV